MDRNALADVWSGLTQLALAACAVAALVVSFAPPQDLPWTPLDLNQPIGLATLSKIQRLDVADDDAPGEVEARTADCMALLEAAGVEVSRATDRDDGAFCVVRGAVRIGDGVTPLRPSGLVMRCPLAARYLLWDREVLRPAAREALGTEPASVQTYGTYACRRIYGSNDPGARPSQHARANALDVAAVLMADGRSASVLRDWGDAEAAEAGPERGFLERLANGGCRLFANVLTPEYNAAHRDHLHLDAAPRGLCARYR